MDNILNEEDITFLKELAHKRKTQETDGCGEPVYWMIYDKKNIVQEDGDYFAIYSDGEEIYNTYDEDSKDDLEELKEHIMDDFDISSDLAEETKYINSKFDLLNYLDMHEYELDGLNKVNFNREYYITEETGAFLTKEAAKKHIEENYYRYSKDVTTYGMEGWRNPEFKRLMEIINKFDSEVK